MAKKPTVTTITSGYNSATQLNANIQALRDAFDNTISRDGSTPNTMSADLDLNGNDILNVGTLDVTDLSVDGVSLSESVTAAAASASAAAISETNAAASETAAAASAATAQSVEDNLPITWEGEWTTATAYAVGDLVQNSGSTYRCAEAHTSGTFSTDLGSGKWANFALKGAPGAGTGDMLGANNLSDIDSASASRTNLGLGAAATKNVTGADANVVTGTAGTSGNLVSWNGDGDAVDSGLAETTSAQYRANTVDKVLTTDQVWGAMAEVTLTDGASIALDLSTGLDFTVTLGGNRTLANPTNAKVGQRGRIRVVQDGTGSRTLAYGTSYKFARGIAPILTTTASAEDILQYDVISPTKIAISILPDLSS